MSQNKEVGIIIYYEDFLKISDEMKQKMLANQQIEWFVSIKKDKYEQLSKEEKQNLNGFKCTEHEPLRKKIPDVNKLFELVKMPENVSVEIMQIEKDLKQKHKKQSRPYVPKIIGNVCSKKKGGR